MTPFQPPTSAMPPMRSGNPVLDEIDAAHATLSPSAKQALEQAHGMMGSPAMPSPMAAPAPASPGDPNGQGAPLSPIARPGLQVRPITPTSEQDRNTSEMHRLQASPSGIGGMHHAAARVPLQILDAIGGGLFPGIEQRVPGTQGHHDVLVRQAERNVTGDTAQLDAESKRQHETTQSAEQLAHAGELGAQEQKLERPEEDEFGTPVSTSTGIVVPSKKTGTAKPLSANGEPLQPYEKPKEPDKPQANSFHVLPDGKVISIHTDPDTGASKSEVVYEGKPKEETLVAQIEVGGKPHSILVNKQTGQQVKDLGETGEKPPVVNVANQDFQKGQTGRSLLDKAEKDYRGAAQSADSLTNFVQAAKSGNKVAAQAIPLEGALNITTAQGVHRINRQEIEAVQGAGSLFDNIMGRVGKLTAGQPIPPDLQEDFSKLAAILKNGAYKTYREAHQSAVKRYGLTGEEPLPDPGSGGTVKMKAPDGSIKPVPADQVDHYKKLGAVPVP